MKGTRLWQAPGSPIIQGRSRTERPFWEGWVTGTLLAASLVTASAVAWAVRTGGGGITFIDAVRSASTNIVIASLPGCMLGAALGVALARVVGWRRPWLAGLVLGMLAGWGVALLLKV